MNSTPPPVGVNGRSYRWTQRPLVVVCVDGSESETIKQAIASGRTSLLAALRTPLQ